MSEGVRVSILVNPGRISRWHLWLRDDLRRAGAEVLLVGCGTASGWPRDLEMALRLDRFLHGVADEHALDRIPAQQCGLAATPATPVDVLINCSEETDDLPRADRVVRPLFNGVSSELGAIAAFLEGLEIKIAVVDDRSPGRVATGIPATYQRASITLALDNVLCRALEIIARRACTPSPFAAKSISNQMTAMRSGSRVGAAANRHLAKVVSRLVGNKISRRNNAPERWALGIRRMRGSGLIEGAWPAKAEYALVPDDKHRFYADPMLFQHKGRTWLFCEELPFATERGLISVAEVASDGKVGAIRPVLEMPYHLSHPFVFEDGGQIWMIPELMTARGVDLFRAVDFPYTWTLERRLIDGIAGCDTVLTRVDGRIYLFLTDVHRLSTSWDNLRVFQGPSLFGSFTPVNHGADFIDSRLSRPAGPLIRRGSDLLRLSQDCSVIYGGGMVVSRIDQLSLDRFSQTEVGRVVVEGPSQLTGTHSYTRSADLEAIDVWGPVDGVTKATLALVPQSVAATREAGEAAVQH